MTAKSNTAPPPPAWEGRGIQRTSVGEDQSLLEPGCEVPAEKYFPLGSPLGLVPSSYKDGWETTRPYAAQAACSRARPTKNHTSVSQETLLEANGHARSQRQPLMPEMPWTDTSLFPPAPASDLPPGRLCTSLQTFPVLLLRKESLTSSMPRACLALSFSHGTSEMTQWGSFWSCP